MSSRLASNQKVHLTYLSEHVDAFSGTAQDQLRTMAGGFAGRVPDPTMTAQAAMSGRLNLQSLSMAFSDGFFTLAALFLLSLVVVFFLAKPASDVDTSAAH